MRPHACRYLIWPRTAYKTQKNVCASQPCKCWQALPLLKGRHLSVCLRVCVCVCVYVYVCICEVVGGCACAFVKCVNKYGLNIFPLQVICFILPSAFLINTDGACFFIAASLCPKHTHKYTHLHTPTPWSQAPPICSTHLQFARHQPPHVGWSVRAAEGHQGALETRSSCCHGQHVQGPVCRHCKR